jgi:hypothetical protein
MQRAASALFAMLAFGFGPCAEGERARYVTEPAPRCKPGARPSYFVPAPPGVQPRVLACARLGVSGNYVAFSGHREEDIGACIDPAYSGRGQRGMFIPGGCGLKPPLTRFSVRDASQPRQGVRGYEFVIWGTAGRATEVVARFRGGTARATVARVGPELAGRLGERPFRLFVVEVPAAAAGARITVVAGDEEAIVDG